MVYTSTDLDRDIGIISKFAEGPIPDDLFDRASWEMARVHLSLVRFWVNVQKQFGTSAPIDDAENYLSFALTWVRAVRKHHSIEEEVFFPVINAKHSMHHNHEQHEDLLLPLTAFETYLLAVRSGTQPWSQSTIQQLSQQLLPPTMTHLIEELYTLKADVLKSNGVTQEDLEKVGRDIGMKLREISDPSVDLVPFILHNDGRNDWPPVPFSMTAQQRVPSPLYDVHKDWWKYGPAN